MKIPLIDLVGQYRSIEDEIDRAIHEVFEKGSFILGPNVRAFEEEIAAYLGVRCAVGVASGTDALVLTLKACGIGPGDEVIVPAFTFFATAEAVSQVGANPVFVDIDHSTYCLDVSQVEAKITSRTKAIIPVHLFGHPADMAAILEVAQRHDLKIIEDNAQAMGAEYQGRKTAALGDAGCLSFFPSKNLGTCGDGGMIVTNDSSLADSVRRLRTHGWQKKYYPEMIGYNSRLDELHAAILRVKLKYLDRWNEQRREIAQRYKELLSESRIELPFEAPYARHVYHLYIIRVRDRKAVHEHLKSMNIDSGIYYPVPLHLTEAYRYLGYSPGSFPESEQASEETLAIPLYPEMKEEQIQAVATAVKEAMSLVKTKK